MTDLDDLSFDPTAAQSTPHFHELLTGPHSGTHPGRQVASLGNMSLEVGLSCDHDSSGAPIDGSELFEIVNLPMAGVTVVDVDLKQHPLKQLFPEWGQMKRAQLMEALRTELPPSLLLATHKGDPISADAAVITAQGWHLVYLADNVEHPLQDPAYDEISRQQRGYWSMRTHNKPEQDLPSYCKDLAGTQRVMLGLTEKGRVLAIEWNELAKLAGEHRDARKLAGIVEWDSERKVG